MTNIILSGCCGKMGRVIAREIEARDDCKVVAGVDIVSDSSLGFPVYDDFSKIQEDADSIIDFSNPAILKGLLAFATAKKVPVVLCTTGFLPEQVTEIKKASERTAIFYSGNMSLGINLLIELSKMAEKVLGTTFDVEIIEKHHNQKLDAPSGTALMIADGISEVMEQEPQYVYDRHSYRKKREKNEIGIHAVRGGTIVGEHQVIFAGHDEVLTLTHQAQSKEVFAIGSINAAIYLNGKKPGMYDMSDMLQGK
ncbi:MAG: 4-hydroxy-tetrahydrodipicolinate reductase [Acutalibacteraceae bacterium]|nr:4-hydroxy-tetrahydrodipicolinate reductase [Acutalibacteraceae bacterium]